MAKGKDPADKLNAAVKPLLDRLAKLTETIAAWRESLKAGKESGGDSDPTTILGALGAGLTSIIGAAQAGVMAVFAEATAGVVAWIAEASAGIAGVVAEASAGILAWVVEASAGIVAVLAEVTAGIAAVVVEILGAVVAVVVGIVAEIIAAFAEIPAAFVAAAAAGLALVAATVAAIVGVIVAAVLAIPIAVATAAAATSTALGMVVAAFKAIDLAIGQFGSQIGSLVGAFSPATLELFDRAVKDFHATFGEMLIPIFRAGTEVVRYLADTFAGLTPTILPLMRAVVSQLRPFFEMFGDGIRRVAVAVLPLLEALTTLSGVFLQALEPVFYIVIEVTVKLVQVLVVVATNIARMVTGMFAFVQPAVMVLNALIQMEQAAESVARKLISLVNVMLEFLGLPTIGKNIQFDGSSDGKGASNAQNTTISAMLAQLDANAFGAGNAADESKAATIQVPGLLQILITAVDGLPAKIGAAIASIVSGQGGGAVSSVAQAVSPAYALREGMRRVTGY